MYGRMSGVLLSMILVIGLIPTGVAFAGGQKEEVCHRTGNGSFELIQVSTNAVQQHIDNHGDGSPGDTVPGMDGYSFDESCIPAQDSVLVQAWSTDAEGNRVLIAQLEDTNPDGIPSIGDTITANQYPLDFDGAEYRAFTVTTHTVASGGLSRVPGLLDIVTVYDASGNKFD